MNHSLFVTFRLCIYFFMMTDHCSAATVDSIQNIQQKNTIIFDAQIELYADNPRDNIILFARYWVQKDYYRISIRWCEPHASDLRFPVYPIGLSIQSNSSSFSITSSTISSIDKSYPKPISQRGPFTYKFGSYLLDDIRFAESESFITRVNLSKIDSVDTTNHFDHNNIQCSPTINRGPHDEIQSIKFASNEKGLYKQIDYSYMSSENHLLKKSVTNLYESPLIADFSESNIIVQGSQGSKYNFNYIELIHHLGGRQCVVDFKSIERNQSLVSIPSKIHVSNSSNHALLRQASTTNIAYKQMSIDEITNEAKQYISITENQEIARDILTDHWFTHISPGTPIYTQTIKLRNLLFNEYKSSNEVATRLSSNYFTVMLDVLIGDDVSIDIHFKDYLAILKDADLSHLAISGGIHLIKTTISWKRYKTAQNLSKALLSSHIFKDMDTPTQRSIINFTNEAQLHNLTINYVEDYLMSPNLSTNDIAWGLSTKINVLLVLTNLSSKKESNSLLKFLCSDIINEELTTLMISTIHKAKRFLQNSQNIDNVEFNRLTHLIEAWYEMNLIEN